MSLAYPFALILSVIALPIIALYILKVRLRRVPVSTNLFWKQIYEEKPPRSIWQHFRHLLSLLLQLLMLLLLMFAVADPYFSWQLLQARRIVLVIDNSASMRANDVSPSRLEAAKREALSVVEGLRFRDQAAIVLAGTTPEVLIGMTGHVPTLKEIISSVGPSDLPTELDSAIELGKQLAGDHAHGQVIVLSDVCVNVA
ncbi:MAG: VWA domain-containing protein, partial [Planctomycetaceae bacterium]